MKSKLLELYNKDIGLVEKRKEIKSIIWEMFKKHKDGVGNPSLILDGSIMDDEIVGTATYLKKRLEHKLGKKLNYYCFITPYLKHFRWQDDYYDHVYIDFFIAEKTVANKLLMKSQTITKYQYDKLLKELPNVFVLKREILELSPYNMRKLNLEELYYNNQMSPRLLVKNENTINITLEFNKNYSADDACLFSSILLDKEVYDKGEIFERAVLESFVYWCKLQEYKKCLDYNDGLEKIIIEAKEAAIKAKNAKQEMSKAKENIQKAKQQLGEEFIK